MLAKPIWCKCKKHSWTRRQLYASWEKNRSIRCPIPDCEREIPMETVEALLIQVGMVTPDEESTGVESEG